LLMRMVVRMRGPPSAGNRKHWQDAISKPSAISLP